MPTIYDNLDQKLAPALRGAARFADRADFAVGYFNLRGWREIADSVDLLPGQNGTACRLIIGMSATPDSELREALSLGQNSPGIDNRQANLWLKEVLHGLREQLMLGAPRDEDESGLRQLRRQLAEGKVIVKLHLRHRLHAKLYLFRLLNTQAIGLKGFIGSSNLTMAGLQQQGELNIDVLEQDAAEKLAAWFDDRWDDNYCIDVTQELIKILDESWARDELIPPYHIYLNMAYHLSREARAGLAEFTIPAPFDTKLFDFQKAAVQIAARHLNQRGGVLIGDVVGLGKTLMATTLAKIFEEDQFLETLIICPKSLERMWQWHVDEYRLRAKVLPISRAQNDLEDLRRYRLVLIDESHNLRNREGKRYKAIREYIEANDSRCILLSATPYNKSYLDLSSQLRLFLPEDADLGIRPEKLLREIGVIEFNRRYENPPLRSLQAFEKSEHAEDWQDLMRLFMVRRTRSFVKENYAVMDGNGRSYLSFNDGTRSYFPTRVARRIDYNVNEEDPADTLARLYQEDVVETIGALALPRYGLISYEKPHHTQPPTRQERVILENLSRGGQRLKGFAKTNLFKRLESSGHAFALSIERHILRNYVFLHALENGLPLPIGTQDVALLDTRIEDEDAEAADYSTDELMDDDSGDLDLRGAEADNGRFDEASFRRRAAAVYNAYRNRYQRRFKWLRSDLFRPTLAHDLKEDADDLTSILLVAGQWDPARDAKLNALQALLSETHPAEKVLVFSQFADTVYYLTEQLKARGVARLEGVTGSSEDPTAVAWRFSPLANGKPLIAGSEDELRVLVTTDVLSEGQNLQDAYIVLNYDLPWAIIRLIQRAGRVDRIGQQADDIFCYNFWPAEGLERIIRLRSRLRERLRQNAEVVGTDETFFEDEDAHDGLHDLYNERGGVLDADADGEVDLVSHAYQIWKNATDADPQLAQIIPAMPGNVYSAKTYQPAPDQPPGVLFYVQTSLGNNTLAWVDEQGNAVTESQFEILGVAACTRDEPALPRDEHHHAVVEENAQRLLNEAPAAGGALGRPSGARFKTYERIKLYLEHTRLLADTPAMSALKEAHEQIYRFPLRETAKEKLNRQLRSSIDDERLAKLVVTLYEENKLCLVQDDEQRDEARIVASLGLRALAPQEN